MILPLSACVDGAPGMRLTGTPASALRPCNRLHLFEALTTTPGGAAHAAPPPLEANVGGGGGDIHITGSPAAPLLAMPTLRLSLSWWMLTPAVARAAAAALPRLQHLALVKDSASESTASQRDSANDLGKQVAAALGMLIGSSTGSSRGASGSVVVAAQYGGAGGGSGGGGSLLPGLQRLDLSDIGSGQRLGSGACVDAEFGRELGAVLLGSSQLTRLELASLGSVPRLPCATAAAGGSTAPATAGADPAHADEDSAGAGAGAGSAPPPLWRRLHTLRLDRVEWVAGQFWFTDRLGPAAAGRHLVRLELGGRHDVAGVAPMLTALRGLRELQVDSGLEVSWAGSSLKSRFVSCRLFHAFSREPRARRRACTHPPPHAHPPAPPAAVPRAVRARFPHSSGGTRRAATARPPARAGRLRLAVRAVAASRH